ncbi:MAG: hypothetical protein QW321_02140 [Candidatus Aenigmatarchaeota archaeon]
MEERIPKFIPLYWYVLGIIFNAGAAFIIYGMNKKKRGKDTIGIGLIVIGVLYMIFLFSLGFMISFPLPFLSMILGLNILLTLFLQRKDAKEIKSFLTDSELEFLLKFKQAKKLEIGKNLQNIQAVQALIDTGLIKYSDETKTTVSLTRTGQIILNV